MRPPRRDEEWLSEKKARQLPEAAKDFGDRASGEKLPVQQLFPFTLGLPTHHFPHLQQQPGFMWHTQKGVYFSNGGPKNRQETSYHLRDSWQGGPKQDLGPRAPKLDYPPLLIWTTHTR